jgi:ParB family chromosome partitioning protein
MSKKRRVFDIDLPDDPVVEETFPAEKVSNSETKRRGPMAAAITENAGSVQARTNVEAQIRAENDKLAHEHVRLKRLGLITDLVPLDQIETYKLTRDRAPGDDIELKELVTSIRDIGLSNPIRIEPRADGKYELVQGFRRLAAYKSLLAETNNAELYGSIPAAIFAQGETLETLYRRMVDENLIRKDISFAEMAKLAITSADDLETDVTDAEKAVATLFQSASYQKRSYIRTFIKVIDPLWKDLRFSEDIPRALGVALAQQIEEVPGTVRAIQAELKDWDNRSVGDELAVLRRFASDQPEPKPGRASKPKTPTAGAVKAKTSFQMRRPQGQVKCVAGAGRLEIRLDRDFSTVDRRKLEMAVQALLDKLD